MQEQTSEHARKNKGAYKEKVLSSAEAFGSFSVNDLDKALDFYRDTLGLDVSKEDMGFLNLHLGENDIFIYPKDDHRPATFTILNFSVDNIDEAVEQLKKDGI